MKGTWSSRTWYRANHRTGAALSVIAVALATGAPQTAGAQVLQGESTQNSEEVVGSQVRQSSDADVVREAARDEGVARDEIVVTGTILRNAPPVGSNLISVGQERLVTTGATTSNELLATVPQVTNLFNNAPNARLAISSSAIQVVRPNLRSLSSETSSSASTLVLFDGHRVAGVGVSQQAVDPDLIPTAAIERVEVVTDGGSATYGSDAVGGVINFITRKRFDGLRVTSRYGFADDYQQVDASGIVGKDWGTGSVYAAYGYQHNDAIFGRDRDFIRQINWNTQAPQIPNGLSCSPGNVQIRGVGAGYYPVPSLAAGAPLNLCDQSDDITFLPTTTRHGAIAGLHQELSDWLTVDVRAFYGERTSVAQSPFRSSLSTVTVTGGSSASNPRQFYYRPIAANPDANQTVFFDFTPVLGRLAKQETSFQEWGFNTEFTAKLNENWGLRTLFNYSRSNSEYHIEQFNQTLLNAAGRGTTATTAVNFYNPSAADLPLIQQIVNSEQAGQGRDDLFNLRAIVDGALFTLPGGEVKVAAGYEYIHDQFSQRVAPQNMPIGAIRTVPFSSYNRDVHAAFGEVQVPIFGADNRTGGLYSLIFAASLRYDHFSDFGSTTNPKFGVTYKPVSWLGLRANYSTSFNAPSPVDQLGSERNLLQLTPFNVFVRPGESPAVQGLVALTGAVPELQPQTAETYSFGFDIDPPFVSGLKISASYYNVSFDDIIRQPSPNLTIFQNFPGNIITDPAGLTVEQLRSYAALAPNGAELINGTIIPGRCPNTAPTTRCNVYEFVDFRTGNYGRTKIEGLDFSANYRMTTGFGGIDLGASGNYQFTRRTQVGPGAPVVNDLLPGGNVSRFQLQASAGADIGAFRAQVTLNHSAGFRVLRCDTTTTPACAPTSASALPQDRVADFNTVNLFLRYAVPSESALLRDLEFTVNVNNLFDQDPSQYRLTGTSQSSSGYYNNFFTVGRLVQFGVAKKF
ncbi:TonB-dependent receptor [Novosphingobium sp. RD2P27]|uniref:TonB-dependent receptor n=1 Tax=Novosphingobium kalidii TaxID=3230299 RepID=A0ABV2CX42_9SPHN